MIARKAFIAGVALGLLTASCLHAQSADKPARIGILLASDRPFPLEVMRLDHLRAALRALGWVEGKNLVIEVRYAGIDPQRQR